MHEGEARTDKERIPGRSSSLLQDAREERNRKSNGGRESEEDSVMTRAGFYCFDTYIHTFNIHACVCTRRENDLLLIIINIPPVDATTTTASPTTRESATYMCISFNRPRLIIARARFYKSHLM